MVRFILFCVWRFFATGVAAVGVIGAAMGVILGVGYLAVMTSNYFFPGDKDWPLAFIFGFTIVIVAGVAGVFKAKEDWYRRERDREDAEWVEHRNRTLQQRYSQPAGENGGPW